MAEQNQPRERPILCYPHEVRAVFAGRQSQLRRVVKPQPTLGSSLECGLYHPTVIDRNGEEGPGAETFGAYTPDGEWGLKCPYGQPRDGLWVRETLDLWPGTSATYAADGEPVELRLDKHFSERQTWSDNYPRARVPSLHMPRWASRLTLEIVSVRVERLQDITDADALAEGVERCTDDISAVRESLVNGSMHCDRFARLWDAINAKRNFSWQSNPWVWVVEFRRAEV